MSNPLLTRRALNAGLATSLVLGSGWRHAVAAQPSTKSERVVALADAFVDASRALFPIDTTEDIGDPRYEALFEIEIAPQHIVRQRRLYQGTLRRLRAIGRDGLDANAAFTFDLLQYELLERLAGLAYPEHLAPVGHMDCLPVKLSQWASGASAQPMKTVANYDNFLARLRKLPAWIDQAIANMRLGIAQGFTLPRPLVASTLPQLEQLLPKDPLQSPFLAGTRNFPEVIAPAQRKRIEAAYRTFVLQALNPALARLNRFMARTYLPAARTTAGLGGMRGGAGWYRMLARANTTTSMTPAEIHALGLKEVARIRAEIDALRPKFNFEGSLDAFIASVQARPELRPFRTEAEVIAAYQAINDRVLPQLPRLFERSPKAPLEIRPIEPIRRDTASDSYVAPAADGSRPGVFYVVVRNPADYARTAMTALFLHEGQPGHHYQIALQREQNSSKFRQTSWYPAYGEGWALYAESLGHELGVYDDPVALMGRLFMELHRALRLVVDTGLHAQGWTRERAIAYFRAVEGMDEHEARNAVERYMGWPGQALAYKIGELKIIELRERARAALGAKFDIRAFHAHVLSDGCMPLSMLEARIDAWIAARRLLHT